jgi:predicted metalloprotease with PDZ domain
MSINNRVIKKISLNEESGEIVIQLRGSSNAIEANALNFKKDEKGNIIYLLLDRLIHKSHEDRFECFWANEWQNGFSVAGCYVSELTGLGGI